MSLWSLGTTGEPGGKSSVTGPRFHGIHSFTNVFKEHFLFWSSKMLNELGRAFKELVCSLAATAPADDRIQKRLFFCQHLFNAYFNDLLTRRGSHVF